MLNIQAHSWSKMLQWYSGIGTPLFEQWLVNYLYLSSDD